MDFDADFAIPRLGSYLGGGIRRPGDRRRRDGRQNRANLIDWTGDPEGMLPGEPTGFCATIIQKIDKVMPASVQREVEK